MKPRYKVTGCARFFIFFIIFIPVVYFGAAYLRGEDGMQELKNLYYKVSGKPTGSSTTSGDKSSGRDSGSTYSVEDLQRQLNDAKIEIRELKQIIKEKDKEIQSLKENK